MLIDLFLLEESHTAVNIAAACAQRVQRLFHDSAILIAMTVDGGRDFQLAAKILHCDLDRAAHREQVDIDDVDDKTAMVLFFFSFFCVVAYFVCVCFFYVSIFKLSCSAYLMSGVLRQTFAKYDDAINQIRRTMVDVSGSPTLLKLLHDAQEALGAKKSNPVLDVPTRFATTFYMLRSYVVDVYRPLCFAIVNNKLDDDIDDVDVVDPDVYEIVRLLVDAAAPVADAITTLEGEQYVTVALLVPLYLNCFRQLDAVNGAPRVANQFRRSLQQALEDKFAHLLKEPNLPLIATMMHPAFAHCDFLGDDVYDACVEELATWHDEWPLRPLAPSDGGDGDREPQRATKRAKTIVLGVDKADVKNMMFKFRAAMRKVRLCLCDVRACVLACAINFAPSRRNQARVSAAAEHCQQHSHSAARRAAQGRRMGSVGDVVATGAQMNAF